MAATLPGTPGLRWQASANTAALGSAVTSVPDSSANAYNGTVSASGSVLLKAGYNGLPAYHTDGTASYMVAPVAAAALVSGPGTNSANPNGWTLAVVYRVDATSPAAAIMTATVTSGGGNLERITGGPGVVPGASIIANATANKSSATSTGTLSSAVPAILIMGCAQTAGSQTSFLFHNGSKFAGVLSGGGPKVPTTNQLWFGAGYTLPTTTGAAQVFMAGEYYDIIIWNTLLSDSDMQSATAYLENLYWPQSLTGAAARKRRTATGVETEKVSASGTPARARKTSTGSATETEAVIGAPSRPRRAASGVGGFRYAASGSPTRRPRTMSDASVERDNASGSVSRARKTASGVLKAVASVNASGSPARRGRTASASAAASESAGGAPARKRRAASATAAISQAATGHATRRLRTMAATGTEAEAEGGNAQRRRRTAVGSAAVREVASGAASRRVKTATGATMPVTRFSGDAVRRGKSASGAVAERETEAGAPGRRRRTAAGSATMKAIASGAASRRLRGASSVAAERLPLSGAPARRRKTAAASETEALAVAGSPARRRPTASGSGVMSLHAAGASARRKRSAVAADAEMLLAAGAATRRGKTVAGAGLSKIAASGGATRKPRAAAGAFSRDVRLSSAPQRRKKAAAGTAALQYSFSGAATRRRHAALILEMETIPESGVAYRRRRSATGAMRFVYKAAGAATRTQRTAIAYATRLSLMFGHAHRLPRSLAGYINTGIDDSATGGPLAPSSIDAPDDEDLDALFTPILGRLMGIRKVYPRWQPTPPRQPEASEDWAALGVTTISTIGYPAHVHDGTGQGREILVVQEEIGVLVSCYGPGAGQRAARLRDGMMIGQNREALRLQGIAYIHADEIRRVPSLVNQGWINRADIMLRFRRTLTRTYPVLNLLSGDSVILTPDARRPYVPETPT